MGKEKERNYREEKEQWNQCCIADCEREDLWVSHLPAYDDHPDCSKCGNVPDLVEYQPPKPHQMHSSDVMYAKNPGTILHRCGRCKYRWRTRTIEVDAYNKRRDAFKKRMGLWFEEQAEKCANDGDSKFAAYTRELKELFLIDMTPFGEPVDDA